MISSLNFETRTNDSFPHSLNKPMPSYSKISSAAKHGADTRLDCKISSPTILGTRRRNVGQLAILVNYTSTIHLTVILAKH